MFNELKKINKRPEPFEFITTEVLWNDPHISKQMLATHLKEDVNLASRKMEFIDKSVEWIASRFSVGEGTRICDFGCGPGLYTIRLAQKGAKVTGLDFSERSIAYARNAASETGLSIEYVLTDYLAYETAEKFDLITMIYCDFCALSPEQRSRLLGKFRGMLKEGGALLFDVCSVPAFEKREEAVTYAYQQFDGFWSAEDYYSFMNTYKYPDEKVVLDQYTIVEENRTWQVYNWLKYFTPETLTVEVEACGLQVVELLGDVAGAPFDPAADEFAVVIQKQ